VTVLKPLCGGEPDLLQRLAAFARQNYGGPVQIVFAGGLLDKGPLSLRQREIVIDRTTARLGCAYEWGVHVAFFADKAGFTSEQVAATVTEDRDAPAGRRRSRP